MAHRRPPLITALALNTAALVVEIGSGIPARSLSLVMDGVHNLSDEAALLALVVAYSRRTGVSGRWLQAANFLNSVGLLAITSFLGWQACERIRHPQALPGVIPIVAGLMAAAANWGVARVLRAPSAEDPAIRLAYVHNLGDTFVSLGPVLAGALVLLTGATWVDAVIALVIAAAIVVPTLRTVTTSHRELIWPESVACAHGADMEVR